MRQSVVNSIMKPHRTRGESKYMLEEIYFSDLCGDVENKDANGKIIGINPQKAWFDNGKYRFQFPSLWYQSTCNNKAIGLRSITLVPDAVRFRTSVIIHKNVSDDPETPQWQRIDAFRVNFTEFPDTNLVWIISDLMLTIKNRVEKDLKDEPIDFSWYYNYRNQDLSLAVFEKETMEDKYGMQFQVDSEFEEESACGMVELLNTTYSYLSTIKSEFNFENVWNRESLFVHASFVNGTSFQVLGKNGEFYTKPSKMYRFNGNSPDFYFELSYDGIHPIPHKFARFVVQLAYIYNDADYMAE